jgi:O-antigen ligase
VAGSNVNRSGTWADLQAWNFGSAARYAMWAWALLPAACAAALVLPVAMAALVAFALLFALVWRKPESVLLLLVALMGNVKINYYAHIVTVFPEYSVLLVYGLALALRAMEGRREPFDRETTLWFIAWTFAGLMSFVSAYNLGRVFSKTMLVPISALVFHAAHRYIQDDRRIRRMLIWLEVSALLMAAYGIVQMVGVVFNIDTSLSFLRRYGNPEFEYSIGAPVLYQLTSTFRANSLFNDPNILAGYLAACIPIVLAVSISPAWRTSRSRAALHWVVLFAVLFCMLLTLSRSGTLGAVSGVLAMALCLPSGLRRPRLWVGLATAGALVLAAALLIGVNPLVLLGRFSSGIGSADYSAVVHKELVSYGLDLLWRHPITGVGMHNFGEYYGREIDPQSLMMMAHNAFLTYFAETGLLGGCLFVGLLLAIGTRIFRALRLPGLRERWPAGHSVLAGLAGSAVALWVSNVFYDYSLRTFVWVFCGLAFGVACLATRDHA